MYYTYLWLREDGTPYYVGKGTRNRAYTNWKHGVHRPAQRERIVIIPAESEEEALATEVALVWYYGRKDLGLGCLRNLTDGGDKPPISKPGKVFTDFHNSCVSRTLKRKGIRPPSRKGVPHSEAIKKQIAASMAKRMEEKYGPNRRVQTKTNFSL
jgi:hypothetical protein